MIRRLLPELTKSNRPFTLLWGARTASTFGNWVTFAALLLHLEATGASGLQVGIALAARELPYLLGPLTGTLADRLDPRRVMIACDLGNSLVIASIALLLPTFPVLVVLIALSSLMNALFQPSGKAAVPRLVRRDELARANTLIGSSTNFSYALGPVIGALVFSTLGFRFALLIDAATFLISTTLLLRLPEMRTLQGRATSAVGGWLASFLAEARTGLEFVARRHVARVVALGMFLGVLFAGIDNVALVFLLRDTFGGPEITVGLALTGYAMAMIVAPLILIRFANVQRNPALMLITGLLLTGVGLFLTGLSPLIALAIGAYAIAGAGNGLENIGVDTLIGRSVPTHMLGRVFGVVYGPILLASAAAAIIGGQLVDRTSPPTAFVIAGSGVIIVAFLVRLLLRNHARDIEIEAEFRQ